ncbi:MAG TPA: HEAT repeat domain-containing protein [Bryobacteraceae bacterium]|nr:HEAT repeat domain-containing protein [Bryobacteraceae bacterium]
MLRFFFGLLAPTLLLAQIPRIGAVEFYGLRKVPEQRVRRAAGVSDGDRLPASKAAVEERIEQVPGVVFARLEAVCCTGDRAILYIGIEERGAPHFDFREPPSGAAVLPADTVDLYRDYLRAFEAAARAGNAGEDLSSGHPLANDPAVRSLQDRLAVFAGKNTALVREVLRTSVEPEHRAIAAAIIGYSPKKAAVVPDLQYAMQDPDESVRANAMRALGALAELAARDPEAGFRVEPTWFVEMLHSIVWSDRHRAAQALVNLTAVRPEGTLSLLRDRGLDSLLEMARWRTPAHAEAAFILLGRIAGAPDAEIRTAWEKGERQTILSRFEKK